MEGFWTKIKQNNKRVLLSINVSLLFIAMLFVRHNAVLFNEIGNVLRLLNIENIDVLLSSTILPIKAIIFIFSQIVSIVCVFQVVCSMSAMALIWLSYAKDTPTTEIQDNVNKNIVASEAVLCGRMIYRDTQRFLC